MTTVKPFNGINVFMSRNLVPPDLYDSLIDALKFSGATLFLCCDSSRSSENDYHVIASSDHDKFEDLRSKGCNLLGPQCVLSCAKENRALPKHGFVCCLAMDGVKVLASGFEKNEKVKIQNMVMSMGGVLQSKASLDIAFVVVKNVLSVKYKWALNILKKPIVTVNWIYQCSREHRVVPHESFKVPPFSALTISVTRIPADERKEMEDTIVQNGGKYSPELTRKCTHLVSDAPEGDKFKVAQRWGHIHIVSRKWLLQSVSRKACLNEDSYPVQESSISRADARGPILAGGQDKGGDIPHSSLHLLSPDFGKTDTQIPEHVLEVYPSINAFSTPAHEILTGLNNEVGLDNDMYLSGCRISLVGFEASEMRTLVAMVRRGGGSRYMSSNDKLTHLVVGNPSEMEKKELRSLASMGVISLVRRIWLEDCEHEMKEVQVLQRHTALDLIFQKGLKIAREEANYEKGVSNILVKSDRKSTSYVGDVVNLKGKLESGVLGFQEMKTVGVFGQKRFQFSHTFPEERRDEIVHWITQGGGKVVVSAVKHDIDFTVQCHGFIQTSLDVPGTLVSPHWIRSCLVDGCLVDVGSHVLYSPLQCKVPLPGFEKLRFCVSQYEEKERVLLRNLCVVLGSKFVEKLTKKVSHLLCKFTSGPKYEAACKWGIPSVTSHWIYECIQQNGVVTTCSFFPKDVTVQDKDAGLYTTTQYFTQASSVLLVDDQSQPRSQTQNRWCDDSLANVVNADYNKRLRETGTLECTLVDGEHNVVNDRVLSSPTAPDLAAAIEDLLAQTRKIQDIKSPQRIDHNQVDLDPVDNPLPSFQISKHWLSRKSQRTEDVMERDQQRSEKKEGQSNGEAGGGAYYGFSETQTDSQVVGYEEDLSGRQMMIERVRARSSMPSQ